MFDVLIETFGKILDKLADLITVKTFITFGVMIVFVKLALSGTIDGDFVKTIIVMVVSFYFGTQFEKNANEKKKSEEENKEDEDT